MKWAAIAYIAIILAGLYGWVVNIWAVVHALVANAPFTPLLIGRIIGVPVAILGAVLGWF